jgi:nitrate reductase alpha subunit
MSHLLDNLLFFRKNVDSFADGHGVVTREDRTWEDAYRNRWDYDKIVRSTHGVNCTGSCSWNVFVKNGIVTWEMLLFDRTSSDNPRRGNFGVDLSFFCALYLQSVCRLCYYRRRSCRVLRADRVASFANANGSASIFASSSASRNSSKIACL